MLKTAGRHLVYSRGLKLAAHWANYGHWPAIVYVPHLTAMIAVRTHSMFYSHFIKLVADYRNVVQIQI